MPEPTQNHGLERPDQGATDWDDPINNNFGKIDRLLVIRGVADNRSNYTPGRGKLYLAIDTGEVFRGASAGWESIGSLVNPDDFAAIEDLPTTEDIQDIAGELPTGQDGITTTYNDENGTLVIGLEDGLLDQVSNDSGTYTEVLTAMDDGTTSEHIVSHEYDKTPAHVNITPRTVPSSAGSGTTLGEDSTRLRLYNPPQGTPENPVELKWSGEFIGESTPRNFGPESIDDFESETPLSEDYIGNLSFFERRTGTPLTASQALSLSGSQNPQAILSKDTYSGRDRTYSTLVAGTGFRCYPEFGIFATGTSYGDLSGYVLSLSLPQNGSGGGWRLEVANSGTRQLLYESSGVDLTDDGGYRIEIEPRSDGTVVGRVIDSTDGTVIDTGSGEDGSLERGKVAFGGNPNTTDPIYIDFDNAEITELSGGTQ